MGMDFTDNVMIVTGAGNGLGRAYAQFLAQHGARVIVNDYGGTPDGQAGSSSVAEAVADEIRATGGEAAANGADVTDATSGEVMVEQALDLWGRVDGIINSAGAIRAGVGFEENTVEDLMFTLDVMVAGSARVIRAAWPHMRSQGYGRVVNISSDSLWGTPTANYVASKGAVFGMTRALAPEAASLGIKVNSVLPSAWTRLTQMLPPSDFRSSVERYFPPEKVAPFVAYLVHESCPWSGEAFQVGANRAARVFLAATSGFKADDDTPLESFAANSERVEDLSHWTIPRDMINGVEIMVSDLEGEYEWQ